MKNKFGLVQFSSFLQDRLLHYSFQMLVVQLLFSHEALLSVYNCLEIDTKHSIKLHCHTMCTQPIYSYHQSKFEHGIKN